MGRRVIALLVVLACPAAVAGADDSAPLPADTVFISSRQELGRIGLYALGEPGAAVAITEQTTRGPQPVATLTLDSTGRLSLPRAATWSCDSRVRRFVASITTRDGATESLATEVLTPSCAGRIAIRAPKHVRRGRSVTARLVDRWNLGDRTAQLCFSGTGLGHPCGDVALVSGTGGVARRVRPRADGQLRIAAGLIGLRTTATVAVGTAKPIPAASGPVVLTTGDSTIEGIDTVLEDAYGSAARVRSDAVPGARLSGPGAYPGWLQRAAAQVKRVRPRVTIISLGGNEGYPITDAAGRDLECCSDGWTQALAERQRGLMRVYTQRGRANVVWLLIPVPRAAGLARVVAAANAGIRRAATGLAQVRVLDLGAIFSADGQFHESIQRDGRSVRVRAPDGLHLTAEGQAIAADAVRALLDREGLLEPPLVR
jgi:lysophospholipase L1-like esterase